MKEFWALNRLFLYITVLMPIPSIILKDYTSSVLVGLSFFLLVCSEVNCLVVVSYKVCSLELLASLV